MGFFYRKSVNFGPFWVNLSKSGVGYSVGGKGFRVGTSARGRRYSAFSIPRHGCGLPRQQLPDPARCHPCLAGIHSLDRYLSSNAWAIKPASPARTNPASMSSPTKTTSASSHQSSRYKSIEATAPSPTRTSPSHRRRRTRGPHLPALREIRLPVTKAFSHSAASTSRN